RDFHVTGVQTCALPISGGLVTNWLHDSLKEGNVIGLTDAFGEFLIPEPAKPVLFIAGGSGITPILSQLDTMADQNYRAPVTLLRSEERRVGKECRHGGA